RQSSAGVALGPVFFPATKSLAAASETLIERRAAGEASETLVAHSVCCGFLASRKEPAQRAARTRLAAFLPLASRAPPNAQPARSSRCGLPNCRRLRRLLRILSSPEQRNKHSNSFIRRALNFRRTFPFALLNLLSWK